MIDSSQIFHFLRSYLEMGLLLLTGYAAFSIVVRTFFKLGIKPRYSHFVWIGHLLLISSIALPLLMLALPKSTLFRPSAQVWSGNAPNVLSQTVLLAFSPESYNQADATQYSGIKLSSKVLLGLIGVFSWIVVFLFLNLTRKLIGFHRNLRTLPIIKRIGRVLILASDHHPVAFATWTPSRAIIVVPSTHLGNYSDYKFTVRHELQHHRQGDTQWIYWIEFLKAAFFWNPGIYGFSRLLSQIQEFACDDFLIGRRNFSSQAYGSCLIRAAESAIGLKPKLVGTAGMATAHDPSLLKRRIDMILDLKIKRPNRIASALTVIGLLVLMTSMAYAAKSSLQDRRLSLTEAKKYEGASEGLIPITVNDLVLDRLNYFIGTPKGRQWVKAGLQLMPQHRKMILNWLKSFELPEELIALPLFESGFENRPAHPPQKGAGIWEFIPETAKRYKLEVSDKNDDRLDPDKETKAAMEYLTDLHLQFKDWRLAIKAYNEGENRVQTLIQQNNSRDPWVLERKTSPDGYLSGVMAMIIILKHPELLN